MINPFQFCKIKTWPRRLKHSKTSDLLNYILTFDAAIRFNSPVDSFLGYNMYFIGHRMIIIMPIVWLFVETFNGKYKGRVGLQLFFIIFSGVFIALALLNEMSASRATADIKRLITYPVAGLLTYWFYLKIFKRNKML